jgi:hypothetical protein
MSKNEKCEHGNVGLCIHCEANKTIKVLDWPKTFDEMKKLELSDPEEKIAYMCGVAWQHELGHALGGNKLYPSVEDLKESSKCTDQCGVVEVNVELVKWVQPQKFPGG